MKAIFLEDAAILDRPPQDVALTLLATAALRLATVRFGETIAS